MQPQARGGRTVIRTASARWTGNLKQGAGTISTETGLLKDAPYSLAARVENAKGTNPEELVGAALAGCFSMKFVGVLTEAGFVTDEVKTTARVTLETQGGLKITKIELICAARVQNIDDAKLQELGQRSKETCPVSMLYHGGAEITLQLTRG